MIVRIDLGTVPPVVDVLDGDDLSSLKALVELPDHTWIEESVLRPHDGGRTVVDNDFESMLRYAASKGWTDHRHRVRAHLEVIVAPSTGGG